MLWQQAESLIQSHCHCGADKAKLNSLLSGQKNNEMWFHPRCLPTSLAFPLPPSMPKVVCPAAGDACGWLSAAACVPTLSHAHIDTGTAKQDAPSPPPTWLFLGTRLDLFLQLTHIFLHNIWGCHELCGFPAQMRVSERGRKDTQAGSQNKDRGFLYCLSQAKH